MVIIVSILSAVYLAVHGFVGLAFLLLFFAFLCYEGDYL